MAGRQFGVKVLKLDVEAVELNTSKADHLPCQHCGHPIAPRRDRRNRVDCEDATGIVTYHLICYDLLVVGRVTVTTQRTLKELHEA